MLSPEEASETSVHSDGGPPQLPQQEPPLLLDAVCPLCGMEAGHLPLDAVDPRGKLVELAILLSEQLRRPLEEAITAEVRNAVSSEVGGLSAQLERTRLELVRQFRQGREPPGYSQQQQQQQQPQQHQRCSPIPPEKKLPPMQGQKRMASLNNLLSDLDDNILARHSEIFERMSSRDMRDDRRNANVDSSLRRRLRSQEQLKEEVSCEPENRDSAETLGSHGSKNSPRQCWDSEISPHAEECAKVDTWGNLIHVPEEDQQEKKQSTSPPEISPDSQGDASPVKQHPKSAGGPTMLMLPGCPEEEKFDPVVRATPSGDGESSMPAGRQTTSRSASAAPLGLLVKNRVSELTAELERRTEEKGATKVSLPVTSLPLWLAGVLPWDMGVRPDACWRRLSLWYQWACLAIVVAAMLLCLAKLGLAWIPMVESHISRRLVDLPVICAGPIGLAAVGSCAGSNMLCKCHGLMMSNVEKTGFQPQWKQQSYWDTGLALVFWASSVATRFAFSDEDAILYPSAFAVCSGAFMALCLCTFHVCNCLTAVIHAFSSNARGDTDCFNDQTIQQIASLVKDWNVIQATIRKSSGAIALLMACLQVALLATLVLGAIDGLSGNLAVEDLIPLALLFPLVFYAFIRAATVTDTCTKVPPFINAHVSASELDFQCQYVVQYIANSAAGFYIFDVQVTTAMVVKMVYFCGAFVFAVATKLSGS